MEFSKATTANQSDQVDKTLSWFSFRSEANKSDNKSALQNAVRVPDRDALYYPMLSSGKRGRCLILNYVQFDIFKSGATREGSEKDVKELVKCFTTMGFEVVPVKNNLTVQETKDVVYFESKYDHSQYDCFALVILSHGDKNDIIYCTDGPLKTDFIFNLFTADRCASLIGKPKLFFIQACRGNLLDSGTMVHDSPQKSGNSQSYFLLPNLADFFLFYSTYPGYYSWRNTFIGSWFIQDLCYVFNAYWELYDLTTMATLVCQKVAFTRESSNTEHSKMDHKKQIPCFMSTLTRLVRFGKSEVNEPTSVEKL